MNVESTKCKKNSTVGRSDRLTFSVCSEFSSPLLLRLYSRSALIFRIYKLVVCVVTVRHLPQHLISLVG